MGIPVKLRGGKLTIGLLNHKKQGTLLKTSHRKQSPKEKTVITGEGMSSSFPANARKRGHIPTSHNSGQSRKVKRRQIWRVVDIYALQEVRCPGEQRITIKDTTLDGFFTGSSERQARIRAEMRLGMELPYARYALLRLERWREVRNQKNWPLGQSPENISEKGFYTWEQLSLLP